MFSQLPPERFANLGQAIGERWGRWRGNLSRHSKTVATEPSFWFGSRARGDHRPDSDADVAVFLDVVSDPIGEQFDLIDQAYDILLNTGVNIQPWVFEEISPSAAGKFRARHLVETVRREGTRL